MTSRDDTLPLPGSMPKRLPEAAPQADFDARTTAKGLLRTVRSAALATIDRNTGHPFASLVNVANDVDGAPVILISRLSSHTANLEHDARGSVLITSVGRGDPLAHPRLTVLGAFASTAREDSREARLRRRFLARHPKSELYAGFADFAFWRLEVASGHLNAGFARAADLAAADLIVDLAGAGDLIEAEEGAVAHMNDDHAETIRLYATKLLGAENGPWRMTGFDPEGADLALDGTTLRLPFPHRINTTGELRRILVELAAQAKAS